MHRPAQAACLGRCPKGAGADEAFGMDRTISGMGTGEHSLDLDDLLINVLWTRWRSYGHGSLLVGDESIAGATRIGTARQFLPEDLGHFAQPKRLREDRCRAQRPQLFLGVMANVSTHETAANPGVDL